MDLQESIEDCFQMGFLPFPGESREVFQNRVHKLIQLHQIFRNSLKDSPCDKVLENHHMEAMLSHFEALWKIRPFWPVAVFSCQSMSPFHLGALCEENFQNENICFIQLHPKLEKYPKFWGYHRDFILLHEMIHLLRAGLDTGSFEEFLAYDTDPNAFRRFLGPFFSSSWMPAVFISQLWILFCFTLTYAGAFSDLGFLERIPLLTLLGIILGILSLPWLRFARLHYVWHRLKKRFKNSQWAHLRRPITLALHEKEIRALSRLSASSWPEYLLKLPPDVYKERLLVILGIKKSF